MDIDGFDDKSSATGCRSGSGQDEDAGERREASSAGRGHGGMDIEDNDIEAEDGDAGEVVTLRRKVRKSKRRTRMRAKTIAMKRLTKEEIRLGALLFPPEDADRPRMRSECQSVSRPCPFVSCKHHLYLDVNPDTGSIKLNFPDLEVWEMKETCSLDVADRGGVTLEEVGEILNLTRERIRQVEVRGLLKLKTAAPDLAFPGSSNDNDR
jgi:hypothetical protein